jgi:hypothetical protein
MRRQRFPFTRSELPSPPRGYDAEHFAIYDQETDMTYLGLWAHVRNGPVPARAPPAGRFVYLPTHY